MLQNLPKNAGNVWIYKNVHYLSKGFRRMRKKIAHKLGNPRMLQIRFHTLRHWKATTAYNDMRITFTGTCTIDRTEGSYKYGDQVQFVLWTYDMPKIEMIRAPNGNYCRMEIAIPKEHAAKFLERALQKLWSLEQ
jgi:integrase